MPQPMNRFKPGWKRFSAARTIQLNYRGAIGRYRAAKRAVDIETVQSLARRWLAKRQLTRLKNAARNPYNKGPKRKRVIVNPYAKSGVRDLRRPTFNLMAPKRVVVNPYAKSIVKVPVRNPYTRSAPVRVVVNPYAGPRVRFAPANPYGAKYAEGFYLPPSQY